MTLRGLLGAFRVGVLEKASLTLAPGQDLPSLLSTGLGLSKAAWTAVLAAVVGGAILAFVYASREFRSSFDYTLGGVVTGLVVVGGWYVSGHIGHLAEDPSTLQEGFVATTALGCTIGQAISGVSTLALGSIITFIFIVIGSAATMKYQYWRMAREG